MKCEFPECEHPALEPSSRVDDSTNYCETHALWVVAGCHLVTNRAGSDTAGAVRRLLDRAGGLNSR